MRSLGLDDGLVRRLREAGGQIAWRSTSGRGRSRGGPTVRIAHLRDEEARVESREDTASETVEVTSGPVGAVVLLLEADRRGPPASLGSRNGGASPGFPDGSIVASWRGPVPSSDARPTIRDLVELARYALG